LVRLVDGLEVDTLFSLFDLLFDLPFTEGLELLSVLLFAVEVFF